MRYRPRRDPAPSSWASCCEWGWYQLHRKSVSLIDAAFFDPAIRADISVSETHLLVLKACWAISVGIGLFGDSGKEMGQGLLSGVWTAVVVSFSEVNEAHR